MALDKETLAYFDHLNAIADASDSAGQSTSALEQRYKHIAVQIKNNSTGLLKYIGIVTKEEKILKQLRSQLISNEKIYKSEQRELEKVRKIVARNTEGVAQFSKAFTHVIPAFKGVMSAAGKMAGSIGAVSFAFNDLVDVSFKYRKAIFDISRLQRISGQSAESLSDALKYVAQNTAMSQMEFLELAGTMQSTFIGVKPSAMAMAKIIGTIGEQFGYDYKKAQKFAEIQAQFPQLSKKIAQGLESIRKINDGIGTADDEKRVKLAREHGLALSQAGEMGSQANDYIQQSLTKLSDSEKKQNEYLKARAKLTKEITDLQLTLSKEIEPFIKAGLEVATKLVAKFSEFKEVIVWVGGASVAVKVLTSSLITLKQVSFAIGGPYVKLAGLVMAAVAAVSLMASSQRKAKEEAEKNRKESEEQILVQNEMSKLSTEQMKKYKEISEQRKKEGTASKDILEEHVAINKEVVQEENNVDKLYKNWEEVSKSTEMQLKIIGNINEALKTAVSTEEEFGGRAEEASKALIGISEQLAKTSGKALSASIETAVKMLESQGINLKIDLGGDLNEQMSSLMKASDLVGSMNIDEEKREKIISAISTAMKTSVDYRQKEADIVKNTLSLQEINVRQQEKFTSAYEARLDAERKLMESAQFGLGASVEMMKQQVELAYTMMKTYADQDKQMQNMIRSQNLLSEGDLKRVQSAKTQAEAEEIIAKTHKKGSNEYRYLTTYALKHQEITKKIMDQQQKIYDLTKDIREGYLDAIREMSAGAGEFEKIIGTQEMGVTQLMDSVKDVTGVAKLNTMALGGLQEQTLTASGVGTQVAGKYGAGGIEMLGGAAQEARNNRIYKYGQSKADAQAAMRGEMPEGRSTVGTANVPGAADTYLAPERLEDSTHDGAYEGVKAGIKESFGGSGGFASRQFTAQRLGVNVGVAGTGRGGVPGAENVSRIQATAASSGALGYNYATQTGSPARASGGYVYGVPGSRLRAPRGSGSRRVRGLGGGGSGGVAPIAEGGGGGGITMESAGVTRPKGSGRSRSDKAEGKARSEIEKIKVTNADFTKDERIAQRERGYTNWDKEGNFSFESISLIGEQVDKIGEIQKAREENSKKVQDQKGKDDAKLFYTSIAEWIGLSSKQGYVADSPEEEKKREEDFTVARHKIAEIEKNTEFERRYAINDKQYQKEKAAKAKAGIKDKNYDQRRGEFGKQFGAGALANVDKKMKDDQRLKQIKEARNEIMRRESNWNLDESDARSVLDAEEKRIMGGEAAAGKKKKDDRSDDDIAALAQQSGKRFGSGLRGSTKAQRAKDLKSKITQAGLQEGVEKLSEEDFQKQKAARDKAAADVAAGVKESKSAMGKAAVIEEERKGHSSAAAERGEEASDASQAAFNEKRGEMDAMYGTSDGGGGGGATIRIMLEKGLAAKVENSSNVAIEIQNAV